ncbi:hypothetical protein B0H17DRAFT_1200952 [Mycena rosella]|uniref:Uncharacterized protein n=1 Tax=Mycena rosella TaxID=1033263 RepID=A0AAD7DHA1_MYCRO|nr:hypothetical protein B0H17DRAFT_1200952 [Mycena rosella]
MTSHVTAAPVHQDQVLHARLDAPFKNRLRVRASSSAKKVRPVSIAVVLKVRTRLSNSAVLNHVSTDVSHGDACAQWFHAAWTAPIQVAVCLIILLVEFALRRGSMRWTDARARMVLGVLGAMRIFDIRKNELKGIRCIQHSQSANIATAFPLHRLAVKLAFVAYTETSKQFDVAAVFASFSRFQVQFLFDLLLLCPE